MDIELESRAQRILDETINEYKDNPIDLININDSEAESKYIYHQKPYFLRTILDIGSYYHDEGVRDFSQIKILEIGAFLGVVSIVLAKLGFNVTVSDIPNFMQNERLLEKYDSNNIKYCSFNLRDYNIPFNPQSYNAVIICETLEHLNFNPIPVIFEINKILKTNGIIYLALPNIARFENRKKMIVGHSIHNPIDDYFAQLDKNKNMFVGLHWREYTTNEVKEMLEKLGFMIKKQYLFTPADLLPVPKLSLKGKIKRILFPGKYIKKFIINKFPGLKDNQRTIASKVETPNTDFYYYDDKN